MNIWRQYTVPSNRSFHTFCLHDCGMKDNCSNIHFIEECNSYLYIDESNISIYKELVDHTIIRKIVEYHDYFFLSGYIHLYPIATPPDGNCLFHSISIQIYGYPDEKMILKKTILHFLQLSSYIDKIKEYWYIELVKTYQELGVDLDKNTADTEWDHDIMPILSNNSPQGGLSIFLLSHIIRRPIFVISHEQNELTGLYLPFLLDLSIYNKNPIVIYYSNGHFSAFGCMKKGNDQLMIQHEFINVKFCKEEIDHGYLSLWLHDVKMNDKYLFCSII